MKFRSLQTISRYLEEFLSLLVGALMAAMVLDVTWQVFTRFILDSPSAYTEELARFLLIWIGLLGAAYAYRRKAHLGLDILSQKLEGISARRLEIFISFVGILFASVIMIYGGIKLMWLTLELNQTSAALEVKVGYIYSAIPLSGALIVIFALDRIFNGDPPADDVKLYE